MANLENFHDAVLRLYHVYDLPEKSLVGLQPYGMIIGDRHHRFTDGEYIYTSEVMDHFFIGEVEYVRTRNTIYKIERVQL